VHESPWHYSVVCSASDWDCLASLKNPHYLTFQYADESGQGKYAIIHLDKKNAREAVACAEAQTGKKVEQIDEE
jgi:hypothetical protein